LALAVQCGGKSVTESEGEGASEPPIRGGRSVGGGSSQGGSSRGGSSRGGSSCGGTPGNVGGGGTGATDPGGSGAAGEEECGKLYVPEGGGHYAANQSHLEALVGVTVLGGELLISGAVDLSPLACLESVGALTIQENPTLATLSGLENLMEINGPCVIAENAALSSVEALGSVVSIQGDLSIENNPALPTCQAERLVETIGPANITGLVSVTGNDDAGTCPDGPMCGGQWLVPTGRDSWVIGQERLETLRGYTEIVGYEFAIDEVQDLSPLECLTRIDAASTEIWYIDATDVHGLEALTEVTGAFGFGGFTESLRGLDSLTRVGLQFWFSGPRLRDLSGLESLVEVGGTLSFPIAELENIEALSNVERLGGFLLGGTEVETLAGLEQLVEVSGDHELEFGHFQLIQNGSLRSLRALANLRRISGNLIIEDNPNLPQCEADWLVMSLMAKDGIGGEVIITGTSNEPCVAP
jgi:hypothetical protein